MTSRAAVVAGALVGAGLVGALARPVGADSVRAIGGDDGAVVELSHRVDVEIADRVATFHVERELSNHGGAVVRAELSITTPTRAVARAFRFLSGDRWIDGVVREREAADLAFEQLTTTGAQYVHGPAELSWGDDGGLLLQAYPMAAGARLRVAYTLVAPVCYTAGRWITDYPIADGDSGLAAIVLHGRGPAGAARIFTATQLASELRVPVDEACAEDVPITGDDERRLLVVEAPPPPPASVRFARVGAGHVELAQLSLDLARELAPAPRGARVVFVVDASRSMGPDGVAAEVAWIGGYLAHVPDAQIEIVLYRRWPERLFGRFVPARDAAARLASIDPARLVPGNGSHVDRGLALAATLLEPAGGPRRVIAFTDERWRPDLDAGGVGAALAALPSDAIVHLVDVNGDDRAAAPALARDDGDELAPVAARWGGMLVTASGDPAAPRGAFAAAALELVRPLRIDGVVLHRALAAPLDADADADASADELGDLAAGAGIYRSWRAAPGPVVIDGKIWGRVWRRVLVSDRADGRTWAALAIADPVFDELPPDAQLALATMAAVVSPVTSMLAIDPRWPAAGVAEGWGESGCGCSSGGMRGLTTSVGTTCTIGVGHTEPRPSAAILAALVAPRVRACAAQHRQPAWKLALAIDTTGAEIVDVHVDGAPAGGGFAACVEDAAWELDLDDRFVRFTGRYDVVVDPSTRP
jgi:Vault protein inter-alpha-trypsin domain